MQVAEQGVIDRDAAGGILADDLLHALLHIRPHLMAMRAQEGSGIASALNRLQGLHLSLCHPADVAQAAPIGADLLGFPQGAQVAFGLPLGLAPPCLPLQLLR